MLKQKYQQKCIIDYDILSFCILTFKDRFIREKKKVKGVYLFLRIFITYIEESSEVNVLRLFQKLHCNRGKLCEPYFSQVYRTCLQMFGPSVSGLGVEDGQPVTFWWNNIAIKRQLCVTPWANAAVMRRKFKS